MIGDEKEWVVAEWGEDGMNVDGYEWYDIDKKIIHNYWWTRMIIISMMRFKKLCVSINNFHQLFFLIQL